MKLAVIGTGYVGVVTSVVFTDFGNQVWGLDINKERIKSLKKSQPPIYEPGLEKFLTKGLKSGRLHFTSSYNQALDKAQIIFICVGTPPKADGDYDLSYVFSAAEAIGKTLNNYAVIVIKSTVPPGTGDKVKAIIQKYTSVPFDVASCPEFLREGRALEDSFHPSRIVIGVDSPKAKKLLLELHRPIKAPKVICDVVSAQLVKYAANAFLATKISFINAIAIVCDKIGADIKKVSQGLGLDPRIGKSFLEAGLGYGGSCFPKDVSALVSFSKRLNYNLKFLREIEKINAKQVEYVAKKAQAILGNFKGKKAAILGLAFKPDTDDLRESRSLILIDWLLKRKAKIQAYDPIAMKMAKKIYGKRIDIKKDSYEAVKGSEVVFIVTEWNQFKKLDLEKVKRLMKGKLLIDGRNIFEPEQVRKIGFIYQGVGR